MLLGEGDHLVAGHRASLGLDRHRVSVIGLLLSVATPYAVTADAARAVDLAGGRTLDQVMDVPVDDGDQAEAASRMALGPSRVSSWFTHDRRSTTHWADLEPGWIEEI